jgi:hypothetical protein
MMQNVEIIPEEYRLQFEVKNCGNTDNKQRKSIKIWERRCVFRDTMEGNHMPTCGCYNPFLEHGMHCFDHIAPSGYR